MDAIAVLKRVAKACPWYDIEGTDTLVCAMCGVEVDGWEVLGKMAEEEQWLEDGWSAAISWMEDECNHADDCPWRLAVEYLANLDNEGYE